jgi:hypothetical protein
MSNEVLTSNPNELVVSDEVRELLRQAAEVQGSSEESSIPYMSIKGKKFSLGDVKLGAAIDVVILADAFDHAYYDKDYDPDVISPPACFAVGDRDSELIPDPISPVLQAATCNTCPQNEFGSSKNGKGKACRNGRRLLIASVFEGTVNLDDLAIINLPPTSLKAYARHTKHITSIHKLPTWAAITKLTFDDDVTWPSIVPVYMATVKSDVIGKITEMLTDYHTIVSQPYNVSSYIKSEVEPETKKKSKMS